MNHVLENPVYNALLTGDQHLSFGNEQVKYFNEEVSPYVGIANDYANGFTDLYELLPTGRRILYAKPTTITTPKGWQLQHEINGLQFVYEGSNNITGDCSVAAVRVPRTAYMVNENSIFRQLLNRYSEITNCSSMSNK